MISLKVSATKKQCEVSSFSSHVFMKTLVVMVNLETVAPVSYAPLRCVMLDDIVDVVKLPEKCAWFSVEISYNEKLVFKTDDFMQETKTFNGENKNKNSHTTLLACYLLFLQSCFLVHSNKCCRLKIRFFIKSRV